MKGLGTILYDFANWSTVCCVPHIANAASKVARILWTVIFIIMLLCFVYQLVGMLIRFFGYPADVSTEIVFEEQLFPRVSFCNHNPLKSSVISSGGPYTAIQSLMSEYTAAKFNQSTSNVYGLEGLGAFERDELARDQLLLLINQLSPTERNAASYSITDVLTECRFAGQQCDLLGFSSYWHPLYGNCFTFSSNATVRRTGLGYGLRMLLTVKADNSKTSASEFLATTTLAGFRLAIHPEGYYAAMDSMGLNVGVGKQTLIGIAKTETIRVKKPYGKCIDKDSIDSNYYRHKNYTQSTCINSCLQRATVARCGCANPLLNKAENHSECTTPANAECLQTLKGDQYGDPINPNARSECGCNPPCYEVAFKPTLSLGSYPALMYSVGTGTTEQNEEMMNNQGVTRGPLTPIPLSNSPITVPVTSPNLPSTTTVIPTSSITTNPSQYTTDTTSSPATTTKITSPSTTSTSPAVGWYTQWPCVYWCDGQRIGAPWATNNCKQYAKWQQNDRIVPPGSTKPCYDSNLNGEIEGDPKGSACYASCPVSGVRSKRSDSIHEGKDTDADSVKRAKRQLTTVAGLGSCESWNTNFASVDSCKEWYMRNGLIVQVYFDSLSYSRWTEAPSYTLSGMLADLGGQAGLWLGLSVISIIEVCGLFLIIAVFLCTGRRMAIRPEKNKDTMSTVQD